MLCQTTYESILQRKVLCSLCALQRLNKSVHVDVAIRGNNLCCKLSGTGLVWFIAWFSSETRYSSEENVAQASLLSMITVFLICVSLDLYINYPWIKTIQASPMSPQTANCTTQAWDVMFYSSHILQRGYKGYRPWPRWSPHPQV